MIEITELVHELEEDYVTDHLLYDSKKFISEIDMLVDNGKGYKMSSKDYDSDRVRVQDASTAFLFMMKYDKSLKNYLRKREESKYDDPILSTNKTLRKMMFTVPEDGLYIVNLNKKNDDRKPVYMVLETRFSDNDYVTNTSIWFIGDKWKKSRDKYLEYKKIYQEEIDNLHYESIIYHDATPAKEVNFKPFDKMVFTDKDKIVEYIDNWINHIPDFYELNVPCKLSILLYGVPGTGKSTFAQALAKYLGIDRVEIIGPNYFEDNDMRKRYHSKYTPSVFLLDDLDTFVFNRDSEKADKNSNNTLQKILAFLDNPPTSNYKIKDGRVFPISIVVATTNYFDRLDDAIKRYGRFDFQFEMKNLKEKEADELCHTYGISLYDIIDPKEIKKDALYSPAYIQALCLANLDKKFKGDEIK